MKASEFDITKENYYWDMNVYEFFERMALKKYDNYLKQESETRKDGKSGMEN